MEFYEHQGRHAVNLDARYRWCDDKVHAVDQFVSILNRGGAFLSAKHSDSRASSSLSYMSPKSITNCFEYSCFSNP